MRNTRQFSLAIATALVLMLSMGCKRESSSSSVTSGSPGASGNSASSAADGATANGPGAVNVTGNVVTYQNVHVEVPWNVSDVATIVKMSQEAASGAGLKLTDGKDTLVIASDGLSIRLNGQSFGAVKPGDRVVLAKDGRLTINGVVRSPEGPATRPTN